MAKQKNNKPKPVVHSDATAFQTVLFYCLLIIFLPIVTFFSLKYMLFDSVLQATSVQSNIYSAVAAVITLHLALGLYLYRAYFNAEKSAAQKED
ncbi:hypothetical protein HA402_002285 [Bradysia odoriphaga]|nr:hypothetical protein HA402_002285 [Bradysia odoriphaga]